jgi:Transposase
MLKTRLANIVTGFRHPISNATSDGVNSRIQALTSNARGFRIFQIDRTRILFFGGKRKLNPTTISPRNSRKNRIQRDNERPNHRTDSGRLCDHFVTFNNSTIARPSRSPVS